MFVSVLVVYVWDLIGVWCFWGFVCLYDCSVSLSIVLLGMFFDRVVLVLLCCCLFWSSFVFWCVVY